MLLLIGELTGGSSSKYTENIQELLELHSEKFRYSIFLTMYGNEKNYRNRTNNFKSSYQWLVRQAIQTK